MRVTFTAVACAVLLGVLTLSPTFAAPKAAAEPPKGQYTSEADAKASCPADTVVWVNLNSKIFHYSGNKSYGTTKSGAYMCEKETTSAGFRASKTEKKKT